MFFRIQQLAAPRESLSRSLNAAVAKGRRARNIGFTAGVEVVRQPFGVATQLLGCGGFPMIGAQHRADVIQVARDAVA